MAELCQIEPGFPNWFMTPNFSSTLFNGSGSAHEKFGVMSRFDNVLFANVLRILRPKYKIRGVPKGRWRVDTCFAFIIIIIIIIIKVRKPEFK